MPKNDRHVSLRIPYELYRQLNAARGRRTLCAEVRERLATSLDNMPEMPQPADNENATFNALLDQLADMYTAAKAKAEW